MKKEKKKVLIVIDVQNDFVTGVLGTPEAQAIIPNVKEKFDKYKNNNDYVIFTKDTHDSNYLDTAEGKKLPEHCIHGTHGWEIVDEINYKGFRNFNNFMVCCKSTFGFDDWDWEETFDIANDSLLDIEIIGISFMFAYIGGCILKFFVGDALVNGLNIIFNTTRFTKPMIPVICATIATIGKYFKTTVDMSRHKGQ